MRLISDADMVARDEDVAWATAFWYWKEHVHKRPGERQHHFGDATKAINGMECARAGMPAAHKRFECYQKVMEAFHNSETPNEKDCYN